MKRTFALGAYMICYAMASTSAFAADNEKQVASNKTPTLMTAEEMKNTSGGATPKKIICVKELNGFCPAEPKKK